MTHFLKALVQRRVVANVLMVAFLAGGVYTAFTIRQEIMPSRTERAVEVSIAFPGAAPDEIETSILIPIENAIRGLDGLHHVDCEAHAGIGLIRATLLKQANPDQALSSIKTAIKRIETLPRDAEEPVVTIPLEAEKVMSIIVHGKQPWTWLRRSAERLRDDLRSNAGLTKVQIAFPREKEISIEVPSSVLREHNLTIGDIAGGIRKETMDLPGGILYAKEADVALRTISRREQAGEYGNIVIAESKDGLPMRLSDIALMKDGFGSSSLECWFNGQPAILLDVYAVGDETPVSVEEAVQTYLAASADDYKGVAVTIFENGARDYRSRRQLLVSNAFMGLALVVIILGLFLTPRLAFWVVVGIPTALLGGLFLTPMFGATFNMLSMFAFIVTIGVVVDDAIMVAEAIHTHQERGLAPVAAAVEGLKEIGIPVLLATGTTIVAFAPMFFVPGDMGILFHQIPAVVTSVLLVSLLEAIFILASHLSTDHPERTWLRFLGRPQRFMNAQMERFVQGPFRRFLRMSLQHPSSLAALVLSALLITGGAIGAGLLEFTFTPTVDADTVSVQATMPYGTPREQTVAIQKRLVEAGQRVLRASNMPSPGIFSCIGARLDEGEIEVETLAGSHYISILLALPPESERRLSGAEFAEAWRKAFGSVAGLEAISFSGEKSMTGGEPIRLDVSHPDENVARKAAMMLGDRMRECSGLVSVDDGIRVGKPELRLVVKPQSVRLGISTEDMARQVRHAFHGAEATRFVRNGNEIRVMVRLDEDERTKRETLKQMLLRTPRGALIPLSEVGNIVPTRSRTSLARRDGRRIFPVTADIRSGLSEDKVEDYLEEEILFEVLANFPGATIREGGEEEENDDALDSLWFGFGIAVGAMYLLLALQFNSYLQPFLVLTVIPMSFVGAVWGHVLLGHDISIISVIGIIAMAGVVVNDSVVLVDAYNRNIRAGMGRPEAILEGACRRFRPIFLTSITTFCGLAPLMLERSEQAQFLIPAAISISFGLAFGTLITLTIVPLLLLADRTQTKEADTATGAVAVEPAGA